MHGFFYCVGVSVLVTLFFVVFITAVACRRIVSGRLSNLAACDPNAPL